jgi:hypothetical protein
VLLKTSWKFFSGRLCGKAEEFLISCRAETSQLAGVELLRDILARKIHCAGISLHGW